LDLKEVAAREAVKYVEDGMVVGLGSGSTAKIAIKLIGEMVQAGVKIVGIPTSKESEDLGRSAGIPIGELKARSVVDLTIDGADEVDPALNLVKGLGGALVREKIVAAATNLEIIIVDESKLVDFLGQKVPLPVEIVKFSHEATVHLLEQLGCRCLLRTRHGERFVSDNGNYIVDCKFAKIDNPTRLETEVNLIPGVVDSGLFLGLADKVIVARKGGIEILEKESVLRPRSTSRAP
jgi:ribose 5-phosphate isomerase A